MLTLHALTYIGRCDWTDEHFPQLTLTSANLTQLCRSAQLTQLKSQEYEIKIYTNDS